MTRLWIVILIDGWKLLDEIMVFRAYKNAINYVLGKTPVYHLELSSEQETKSCGSEWMDCCFSTMDSALKLTH